MKLLNRILGKNLDSDIDIVPDFWHSTDIKSEKDDEVGQLILEYLKNHDDIKINKSTYSGYYFILNEIYHVRCSKHISNEKLYFAIGVDILSLNSKILKELYEEIEFQYHKNMNRDIQKRLDNFKEALIKNNIKNYDL